MDAGERPLAFSLSFGKTIQRAVVRGKRKRKPSLVEERGVNAGCKVTNQWCRLPIGFVISNNVRDSEFSNRRASLAAVVRNLDGMADLASKVFDRVLSSTYKQA